MDDLCQESLRRGGNLAADDGARSAYSVNVKEVEVPEEEEDKTFPFEEARVALQYLLSAKHFGKVVLVL